MLKIDGVHLSGINPEGRYVREKENNRSGLPGMDLICRGICTTPASAVIEELISENIDNRNTPHRAEKIASEVRALYHALSQTNQRKLDELLVSLRPDRERIGGIIWGGGAMRVVSETAASITLNTIFELLGIVHGNSDSNRNELYYAGSSAGAFQEIAFAARSSNRRIINGTCQTDFQQFHLNHETARRWLHSLMRRGLKSCLGSPPTKFNSKVFSEVGANPQLMVGSMAPWSLKINGVMLPEEAPHALGIAPDAISYINLALATHYMPGLYWSPSDMLRGNRMLTVTGKSAEMKLLDAGIFSERNNVPTQELETEIEASKTGMYPPRMFFVIASRSYDNDLPDYIFGKRVSSMGRAIYKASITPLNLISRFSTTTRERLKAIGAERLLIETHPMFISPETGKEVSLHTADFTMSTKLRKQIVASNLATRDFKEAPPPYATVIDQLHNNLVDPEFVSTNGSRGKSAYKLFTQDIAI